MMAMTTAKGSQRGIFFFFCGGAAASALLPVPGGAAAHCVHRLRSALHPCWTQRGAVRLLPDPAGSENAKY